MTLSKEDLDQIAVNVIASRSDNHKSAVIELFLPIMTVSEANSSENRFIKARRHKKQQARLRLYLSHISKEIYPIPCDIRWKRVGDALLDTDNLIMAFKWLRDELSDIILGNVYSKPKPGKDPKRLYGRNDSDPRLHWDYCQDKGDKHGIWLTIEPHREPYFSQIPNCQPYFFPKPIDRLPADPL